MKLLVIFVLSLVIVTTTGKNNMEAFRAYLRLVEEQMERDSEHDMELKNWGYYYGPLRGPDGATASSTTMCLVAPKEDNDKTKEESESSDKEISTPAPNDPGWREASSSNVEERTHVPAMMQTRTAEPANVGWKTAMPNYNGWRNPMTSNVGWRTASSSNNNAGWGALTPNNAGSGAITPNPVGWRTAAPSTNAVRTAPSYSGWKSSASSQSASRPVANYNNGWRAAAPSGWSYTKSSPQNNYGGWGWSPNEYASGWNRGWKNPAVGHNFRQISQAFNSGWASRGHHGFGEAPQASGWTNGCVCKAAGVQSNVG